jgi:mannose-6-phosphate isomerase
MNDGGPFRGERIAKPWGFELIWAHTDRYVGKILHIEPGQALSLQYHRVKDETLHVLSGSVRLEVGDHESRLAVLDLQAGESIHLPPGRRHRLIAADTCEVLEASTSEIDDVVRLADLYGRAGDGRG